jgi:Tfp pilus assembly protein PilF
MSVKVGSRNQRRRKRRELAEERKAGARSAGSSLLALPRTRQLTLSLLLALVTLAVYSPAIRHRFIFNYDDEHYVTDNSHVQAGLTWETFVWALNSTEYSNWHPLTWLSHALDCELYGANPAGHHFSSIVLHALGVGLLFLLLARTTGSAGRSFLVAALWAIHPFNVESVAWVAERKNVLSTFFFLLTLGAYGWYAHAPALKRYAIVAMLFVCGLAAKPMVITLPCVLLLLDFWPLRRIQGWGQTAHRFRDDEEHERSSGNPDSAMPLSVSPRPFSQLVVEKLPLLALCVASGAVTIFAQRSGGSMRLALPLGVRLENAVYAYAVYVWKTLWPVDLAVFYPHPGDALAGWRLGLAAFFVLTMSVLAWQLRSTRPYLLMGWLWFLGTLVPVIGVIQVGEQAMADRYAYVPLIGLLLMMVWGGADLADYRRLSVGVQTKSAAAVLFVLTLLTWRQLGYWQSAYELWSHAVDVTKNSYIAEENLGVTLIALKRFDEALPHLQKAARIRPNDPWSHLNVASDLALSGHKREAIPTYEGTIPLITDPKMLVRTYEILGRLYGELEFYSQARANYEDALRINPQQASARDALAKIEFSEALRNVAESPSGEGYLRLGKLLQQVGRLPEALTAYKKSLELDPKLREARKSLDALEKVKP